VFHVELRQFPNVARAFNLEREELQARILDAWIAERTLDFDDRRWSPEKARLTIYEGPRVAPEEMGLGRGWANVTRSGEDVTDVVVEQARQRTGTAASVEQFKRELEERAGAGGVSLEQVLSLSATQNPGRRVSEQLALAEQAVWELLHQRRVSIVREGEAVPEDEWQLLLLTLGTWTRRGRELVIRPPGP
jgi:hypothetical protein